MGSWLSGLFTGEDPTLTGDINEAGNIGSYGEALGEGDLSAASKFDNTLLGGNQAAISKELAPEIGAITGRGQQEKKTLEEFGNRSGGENSAASGIDDKTRAGINDMQSELTSRAAGELGQLGTSSLGLGLTASRDQAAEEELNRKNEEESLLGAGLGGLEDIGLMYLGDEAVPGSQEGGNGRIS